MRWNFLFKGEMTFLDSVFRQMAHHLLVYTCLYLTFHTLINYGFFIMISEKLLQKVRQNEGFRAKPYRDTVGKLTIGYGFNLDDNEIPRIIAEDLLQICLNKSVMELFEKWPDYTTLTENRKDTLIDMAFNLGINGLAKFKKMHKAIESGDFNLAALEILDSKYAKQVGNRAIVNAEQMRQG